MNEYQLQSQKDALELLDTLFGEVNKHENQTVDIDICEDICFGPNKWLNIGKIELFPDNDDDSIDSPVKVALKFGSYQWQLPDIERLLSNTMNLMTKDDGERNKWKNKTKLALESIADIVVRCGLSHPVIDADATMTMPFKYPVTVVADTTSVLQGGLDFIVRFLYPMARVKIPAIVQMEILNMADRYFSQRRKKNRNKGIALFDHVCSQGGQRVLLRLELQTDTEIERPREGADPLRGIFRPDKEDTSLGLQTVQRSFADRLILETAIRHKQSLSSDHQVMLLTSDQGLARMTLSEGMQPIYFDRNFAKTLFRNIYCGTIFKPFVTSSNSKRLYYVPLTELLWELGVTFGNVRLVNHNSEKIFEACAIGEKQSWNPYHAKEDLLWTKISTFENIDRKVKNSKSKPKKELKGSYKFSIQTMLKLISIFREKVKLSDQEGMEILDYSHLGVYSKLRNFLLSGGMIEAENGFFSKTDRLDRLWESFIQLDFEKMKNLLKCIPSFMEFIKSLKVGLPSKSTDIACVSRSAFKTYCTLAEICCAGLVIPEEGIYGTPKTPPVEEFSSIALKTYKEIAKGGERYILTGLWLEKLAKEYGIHPITVRNKLNKARQEGYIERYTEGSTPETQFEKHKMNIISINQGLPVINKIYLYHGDFIIHDRTSVSIRIERKSK